jgi:hypothetical protein
MKIEFTVPLRRSAPLPALTTEPAGGPQGRPHRIARVLALAHRLDELVHSGAMRDYRELARLGHVSSARVCQFMTLLHLAPAIQEYLLFMTSGETIPITQPGLRKIAREPRWDRQQELFERLCRAPCNSSQTAGDVPEV